MPEAHEQLEHAEHMQHAAGENKKIAMLIAVLALFLSFSETLGKSAQTEAMDANVKSADTWAFSQAKDIRRTVLNATADQTTLLAAGLTDPAAKSAVDKQIDAWRKTAARYESDPSTGEGLKELRARAKDQEEERDLSLAKYHHYEVASAAFQGRHRAGFGNADHRHLQSCLVLRRAGRHWLFAIMPRPVSTRPVVLVVTPHTAGAADQPACRLCVAYSQAGTRSSSDQRRRAPA